MRVFLTAAMTAATLLLATAPAAPAAAQVMVPAEQAEAAGKRAQRATAGAERVTALLLQIVQDPDYTAATTPTRMQAYLVSRRDKIAASRREIRQIAADLSSLPRISGPSDPMEIQISDRLVTDISGFALRVDGLLGDLQEMGDALAAGDDQRAQRAAGKVVYGSVMVVEAQSMMLRSRLTMVPADSSNHARISGLACFYDGIVALQEGMYGLSERDESGADLGAAAACMRKEVARARVALDRELAEPEPEPALVRIRTRLAPVYRDMHDLIESGATLMDDTRAGMLAGISTAEMADGVSPRVLAFEQAIMALTRREVDIATGQGT
jgi:hypothetical protein